MTEGVLDGRALQLVTGCLTDHGAGEVGDAQGLVRRAAGGQLPASGEAQTLAFCLLDSGGVRRGGGRGARDERGERCWTVWSAIGRSERDPRATCRATCRPGRYREGKRGRGSDGGQRARISAPVSAVRIVRVTEEGKVMGR